MVNLVVTDLGVFDVTAEGLVLVELAPGVTVAELRDKTEAAFRPHPALQQAA